MSTWRLIRNLAALPIAVVLYNHFSVPRITTETDTVTYLGQKTSTGNAAIFYGIKYAEPPIGERRFRAPVPLEYEPIGNGRKIRVNALQKPAFCIQASTAPHRGIAGGAGSEDCLHLNVYQPLRTDDAKLPVLVYIHGGGWVNGNPLSWPFEHWVEEFPDVVIVSVYYRLGIFGFIASPSDMGSFDYNAGFLDQVEALKWVKQNIHYFGGDPEKITINGQSAGGGSVQLHLLSQKEPQGLFHQAMTQSVYRPSLKRPSEIKDHFDWVATHAGCDTLGYSDLEKLQCLHKKDVSALIRAADASQAQNRSWGFLPVIDGIHFSDTPTTLVNKRKLYTIPVLAGSTTDEAFNQSDDFVKEVKDWYPMLSDKDVKKLQDIYKIKQFNGSELERTKTAVGELVVRSGGLALLEAMTKAGKASYAYRFDEPNPTQADGDKQVHHSAENWWMFQGSNTGNNGTYTLTPFTPTQHQFAKELIAYWLSFVRSGDPNTHRLPGSPEWPRWDNGRGKGKRMVLAQGAVSDGVYASGSHDELVSKEELERCRSTNAMAQRLHF